MDRFIVSARKYRPQQFDSVLGQDHITTTLKNAIRNQQLAHAFLFCGPRGVGKTTCARILAKTINCEKPTAQGEACNKCSSCASFNEGASMNYFELDAASNNSVDDIRQLTEQVRFAPQAGRYKVYVIDEVHMLSPQAFNAFLKTLEEPPPYAIFILATTEKHKILPTILSRCQIFDFKRITTEDTVAHLEKICQQEKVNAERPALQLIAQKSEGCLRDALSMLDKIVSFTNGNLLYTTTIEHLNILDADYYFKLLAMMQQQDLSGMIVLYDEINRKGFEGDLVLNGLAEFFRNLLVCKDRQAAVLLDTVETFKLQYEQNATTTSAAYLVSALNILSEAELNYRTARNKRLHVEMALIKLAYLQQALSISTDDSGLVVKKKIADAPLGFRTAPIRLYTGSGPGKKPAAVATAPRSKPATAPPSPVTNTTDTPASSPDARLTIETPRLSALDKIRQQFKGSGSDKGKATENILESEALTNAWGQYTDKLRTDRNPAAQPFGLAQLRISDATSFEVVTSNNIEQKFIEQERNALFEFLQQQLQIRGLQFTVLVQEPTGTTTPVEGMLSSKEQFQELVKQYPLVQELKERLRLELDY
ncbi:MAG: DNA polymerase III subunit gamma/tau [Bacteroidetes bacterium]|nr:DNA polymerase III subunit gamma/tau [Bacteroidota bacterium]